MVTTVRQTQYTASELVDTANATTANRIPEYPEIHTPSLLGVQRASRRRHWTTARTESRAHGLGIKLRQSRQGPPKHDPVAAPTSAHAAFKSACFTYRKRPTLIAAYGLPSQSPPNNRTRTSSLHFANFR